MHFNYFVNLIVLFPIISFVIFLKIVQSDEKLEKLEAQKKLNHRCIVIDGYSFAYI